MTDLPQGYSFATLEAHLGLAYGPSRPVVVDQARIAEFAEATGDHQWIHIDVERARRESPYGATIAHGFLTLSLVAEAMEHVGIAPPDASAVVNYGVEKVRFLSPVIAGSTLTARFVLKAVEPRGDDRKLLHVTGEVTAEGAKKPALIGEFLVLIVA